MQEKKKRTKFMPKSVFFFGCSGWIVKRIPRLGVKRYTLLDYTLTTFYPTIVTNIMMLNLSFIILYIFSSTLKPFCHRPLNFNKHALYTPWSLFLFRNKVSSKLYQHTSIFAKYGPEGRQRSQKELRQN